MKKHTPTVLVIATIIVCTTWLTLEQDRAQRDRYQLFNDLIEQSWKIQTDMNGMWEQVPGGSRRTTPGDTEPSIRKYLIDAADRDEAMRELLLDMRTRLDKLETPE